MFIRMRTRNRDQELSDSDDGTRTADNSYIAVGNNCSLDKRIVAGSSKAGSSFSSCSDTPAFGLFSFYGVELAVERVALGERGCQIVAHLRGK